MTDAFARMLDQTYQDSLDFPALAKFCTADQIMSDYRRAESFCPDSWFWVSVNQPAAPQVDRPANRQDSHQQHRSRVGCVVLGYHRTADVDRHGADTAASTAELVYMGLVPAARGGGLGHALLRSAIEQAEWSGADRLILAVDRKNVPAQRVYAAAGMQSELQEHWWGKLIIARANDEVSGQEA